jgi:hypothetical protein
MQERRPFPGDDRDIDAPRSLYLMKKSKRRRRLLARLLGADHTNTGRGAHRKTSNG